MATMTYKEYLKKTGKPSTSAAARLWDRLYNNNQRFNPEANKKPEFDFNGPLDLEGTTALNNLDYAKRTRESALDTDYNANSRELDAQQVNLDYQRNEGLRSADSNAAGRGLARSGIRDTNRGNVLRGYIEGSTGIGRQRTNLANQRQSGYDQLNADYQQDSTDIRNASVGRRYQKWRDNGGGAF